MGPKGKYFQARAVNSCYINPGFKSYLNQSRHSERCLVWVSPSLSPPIYSLTTESIDYTDDSLHTPSLLFFFKGPTPDSFLVTAQNPLINDHKHDSTSVVPIPPLRTHTEAWSESLTFRSHQLYIPTVLMTSSGTATEQCSLLQ